MTQPTPVRAAIRVAVFIAALLVPLALASTALAAPANIALFNDGNYVDNGPSTDSEATNEYDTLTSQGHHVTRFEGITAADFSSALAGKDVLVIPEQEQSCSLGADLSADAKAVIRGFVAGGHGIVFNYDYCDTMNAIFGFSTASGSIPDPSDKLPGAAGTEFAGGPASIPDNDGSGALDATSLPSGSRNVYGDASNAAVADIPFGAGSISWLGWDWFDAAPDGTQDGGWLAVLDEAVRQPVASVSDSSVNEPQSGNTTATFHVTLNEPVSEEVTVNYSTSNGTASAGSDYDNASGTLTFARGETSKDVTVTIHGDKRPEGNETFNLNLTAARGTTIGDGTGVGTIVDAGDHLKPVVSVGGVRSASRCSARSFSARVRVRDDSRLRRVEVRVDGKLRTRTTRKSFRTLVRASRLKAGRHRLTVTATDSAGNRSTTTRRFRVCAARRPAVRIAPHFTG